MNLNFFIFTVKEVRSQAKNIRYISKEISEIKTQLRILTEIIEAVLTDTDENNRRITTKPNTSPMDVAVDRDVFRVDDSDEEQLFPIADIDVLDEFILKLRNNKEFELKIVRDLSSYPIFQLVFKVKSSLVFHFTAKYVEKFGRPS